MPSFLHLPTEAQLAAEEVVGSDTGTVSWSISAKTTEKPINDSFNNGAEVIWRQNEDRFHFEETGTGIIASVADGAGSSGMFCGDWAGSLVDNLPAQSIDSIQGLNEWIDGFWKDFSDTNKQRATNDPVKLNKFVREGSCSTLTACWIEKNVDTNSPYMNWLCYGDSHLCAFERSADGVNLRAGFPASLQAMNSDPHLLNWKNLPDEKHLRTGRIDLSGPMVIVLASDGIGEYMHMRYLADVYARQSGGDNNNISDHTQSLMTEFRKMLNSGNGKIADLARNHIENPGNGFAAELATMGSAMETQEGFTDLIKQHHGNGLLSNDDATMIIIDINVETDDSPTDEGKTETSGDVVNLVGEL